MSSFSCAKNNILECYNYNYSNQRLLARVHFMSKKIELEITSILHACKSEIYYQIWYNVLTTSLFSLLDGGFLMALLPFLLP